MEDVDLVAFEDAEAVVDGGRDLRGRSGERDLGGDVAVDVCVADDGFGFAIGGRGVEDVDALADGVADDGYARCAIGLGVMLAAAEAVIDAEFDGAEGDFRDV